MNDTLLSTPLGAPGSGRVRYGAAMALHAQGRISADQLEVYRMCAPLDAQDPAPVFAERRLPAPTLPPPSPETLIRALVDEADRYLARLDGPGVAEVRAGLVPWRAGPVTLPTPAPHPVVAAHLPAALAAAAQDAPALAAAIAAAAPHLAWASFDGYDPDEIGADFAQGQAYALLVGEDSPIKARDYDLGLFLIAPQVLYRDHAHGAPELYAPLTGPHGWRFTPGGPLTIQPAHVPVWNPSHRPHLIKAGPVPYLCLYGWTRDVNAPAYVIPAADWAELQALRL